MLKIVTVMFVVLFFLSCKKNSSECTDDSYSYDFYSSKQIDTTTINAVLTFQVNPGNNLVFSYVHNGPDCKNVADDEYTDRLVFQVSPGLTTFYYENTQLEGLLCLFVRYGFVSTNAVRINSGHIRGTKISDTTWDIEIDVNVGGTVGRITLKRNFILR